ncbi:hypothetical protein CDAR_61411 [Caerostris darwini]|uniref:Transposase n=1 Tax=Caerostris darwini TaxID=1538125 RepID=A0AAV4V1T0_9ARAC|nr:hypothetical protein CDAR_61411 [Caerostris darwini]
MLSRDRRDDDYQTSEVQFPFNQLSYEIKTKDLKGKAETLTESSILRKFDCSKIASDPSPNILREFSFQVPPCTDLQRELLAAGVSVNSSTVQRRLIEVWRWARSPIKQQILIPAMNGKRLLWAGKYQS